MYQISVKLILGAMVKVRPGSSPNVIDGHADKVAIDGLAKIYKNILFTGAKN